MIHDNRKAISFDRLDHLAMSAIMVLAIWIAFLVSIEMAKPDPPSRKTLQTEQPRLDPQDEKMLKSADNLMKSGGVKKAQAIINELKKKLPFDARPMMMEGNLYWLRQKAIPAMHSFRRAIDLDLDYLDKKSPLFQGKLIRNVVEEAKTVIEKGSNDPAIAASLKTAKKEYYYMLRKLAGGCNE